MGTEIIYDCHEMMGSALELLKEGNLLADDKAIADMVGNDLAGVSSEFLTKISEYAFYMKDVELENLRKDITSYATNISSAAMNMEGLDEAMAEMQKG